MGMGGLWKRVVCEVVEKVEWVIGEVCVWVFVCVDLCVEWIKW